jgi:BASS family bile acid:Na+ symporter
MNWQVLSNLTVTGLVSLASFLVIALTIGHISGGPAPGQRTSLALACATRHIGLALLIAGAFPGERTSTLTAAYLLTATAVTVPYLMWRGWAATAPAKA